MKRNLISLFLIVLLAYGCSPKKTDMVTHYLEVLKEGIGEKNYSCIDTCITMECYEVSLLWHMDHSGYESYWKLPTEIENHLDSLRIYEHRDMLMLIAMHRWHEYNEYDILSINEEILEYHEEADRSLDSIRHYRLISNLLIAEKNYSKFIPGDTIDLVFPFKEYDGGIPEVAYFNYEFGGFIDTLNIKALLVYRKIRESGYSIDDLEIVEHVLFFDIIEMNFPKSYLMFDLIEPGDRVELGILRYGRDIHKVSSVNSP